MNQTEFLKNKNGVSKSPEKAIKKSAKKNTTKRVQNNRKIAFVMIGIICVGLLGIIFFFSFYLSYSKITENNNQQTTQADSVIQQKDQEISALKEQLEQRDTKIRLYEAQIEEYQSLVDELEEREQYAREIAEELKNLPRDQVRVIYVPEPTPEPSSPNTDSSLNDSSNVQQDLYQPPEVIFGD